jgi:ABC-type branched-subunit amino acid transport system ATPase component
MHAIARFMGRRRVSPARISFNLTIASTHFRRARLGIARTWQSPRLFSSLSILDNLLISDRSYPGESLFDNIFKARKVASAERGRRVRKLLNCSSVSV